MLSRNLTINDQEVIIIRNLNTIKMRRLLPMRFFYIKKKIIIIFICIVVTISYWHLRKTTVKSRDVLVEPVELQYVVVHIDLKGAPPRLEYLSSMLPMMKDYGVNGLLMEYEDMFPYEGNLVNLSAINCYERSKLKNFLKLALELGFEVIPLIQTYAHLEYALKLKEFKHLREDPTFPNVICPTNVQSKIMIQQMLEQVVVFHSSISPLKHIHVGCDEVFIINQCGQCKRTGFSNKLLFIKHVKYVSNVISNMSPNTTVLIWDDMLRKIRFHEWNKIEVFKNVETVHWNYDEWKKFPHVNFMSYRKKFEKHWVASAFKGADGFTAVIPNMHKRLMNHHSMLSLLQTSKVPGERKGYNIKGIILTGWSRYNHMDPLCELLPVSISSLIINLRMIRAFKIGGVDTSNIDNFFSERLFENDEHFSCDVRFKPLPTSQYINDHCNFTGYNLHYLLNEQIRILNYTNSFIQTDEILTLEYYFLSNYVTTTKEELLSYIEKFIYELTMVEEMEKKIALAMKSYFETDTITEYLVYRSYYLKKRLVRLIQTFQKGLSFNGTWERRSNISYELFRDIF